IGTMVYDRRTGFYTALICATMFSFFSYARYALLDMMLVFFETAMVFFFIRGMTYPERKKSSYCALYLCAAGALYVKGPVGLFVPFMGIVVYLWKSRRLSEVRALNPLLGISCALMCVLPWVLYVYKTVPDIWGVISHETVNRFFNPYDHIRSFLHFIFQTPFCMMPWTVCIPLVVWDIVKHRRLKSYLFPVSFFLPAFLFFSLCPSKQSHYLLPLYPFMALAVSKALQNFAVYARARSKESLFCRLTCPTPLKAGVVAAGIFLGILGYMVLIPWLNSRISVEPFCRQLDKIIKPEDHLVAFDYAKPYFCFYLRRIIPEILTEEELEEYLIEYSAYVIMERENWEKLGHINGHVVLNYENDKDKIVVIKKGSPHARFITRTFNHNTCI
ncbi:phospholipid carrier-dependent glycosyltransferase, partial [bacterium]|nr:phospholipid carrier-dependent glycosyltransferase [bacterium]